MEKKLSRNKSTYCCLFVALVTTGCGGEKTYPVSGQITWNGKPIEKGHIAFIAEDQKTSEAVGNIVNGRYETTASPGWKRVEVYADQSQGYDKMMQQEIRVPLVTPEYNAESKLRFEVKTDGKNTYDLALPTSK